MGIIELDAYVILLSGNDRYTFLDGLSTNKVEQSCSTVLTTTSAKIIDVIDVIEVGDNVAIVGYGPYKNNVLNHLQPRILQQDVSLRDISAINSVYLSTDPVEQADGLTISESFLGWIVVTSIKNQLAETMTEQESLSIIEQKIPSPIRDMKFHQKFTRLIADLLIWFMKPKAVTSVKRS